MQLLILFCLQTDLMNHLMFSWIHGYFLKILIFPFSYYSFFCIPGTKLVMVPGDYCFYVYCVNVHFYRKKIFFVIFLCFHETFPSITWMYLCICTTKDSIDKSNSSAESLIEGSNDSDFKPLGDSLTLASSSNFSSEEELSDKSMPSKHRSTRNVFLKNRWSCDWQRHILIWWYWWWW